MKDRFARRFTQSALLLGLFLATPALRAEEPAPVPPGPSPIDTGIARFEEGDDGAAEKIFRAEIRNGRGNASTSFYLGRIHLQREESDDAIERFVEATEREPSNSDYHLWLGRAYLQKLQSAGMFKKMGLSKQVRARYLEAIELDPDNLSARESLAGYYFNAPGIAGGSDRKGMEQVEAIKARDARRGHYALASHYLSDEKFDLAEKEYQAALKLAPDDPATLHRLGRVFELREDYDQAFAYFERVLEVEPGEPQTLYAVGRTAAVSGLRLDQGIECLQRYVTGTAVREGPARTWAYWRLGMIYERKGDPANARKAYQAAVAADPDNETARKALENL